MTNWNRRLIQSFFLLGDQCHQKTGYTAPVTKILSQIGNIADRGLVSPNLRLRFLPRTGKESHTFYLKKV